MTSTSIHSALQILNLVFVVVAVLRLIQLKLYRLYPFFFILLFVPVILQTVSVFFGVRSIMLLYFYRVLEPIRSFLYILVVFELFSVIFKNYAGLRSLSRWVMGVAAGIAVFGFILTFAAAGSQAFSASKFVRTFIPYERGISFGLVIFLMIMLYFISRYPIKLPRNSVVLCLFYSIWFLGNAAVLLLASFVSFRYLSLVNDALAVLEIACYMGWAFLLSRTGEYQETRVRRDISPEHEQALIGELNAMNELLLRAGRSISQSR